MSDIFREIDEELRQERYLKLWRAYGNHIIAAVVVILLAVAGGVGWHEYKQSQARAASDQYFGARALALKDGQGAAAAAFAELAKQGAGGYRILAAFQAAAAQAAAGDKAAAIATYDSLANDSGAGRRYRDLATLLSVLHQIDSAPPAGLLTRLAPLEGDGNAWRFSAREMAALLHLKAGDEAAAKKGFAALSDDTGAPADLRARAAEMLAALGGGK